MTAAEIRDFAGYLLTLTDNQVRGVFAKEISAGRDEYATLAELEARRRGTHKAPMAAYWKAVAVYANHTARALRALETQ